MNHGDFRPGRGHPWARPHRPRTDGPTSGGPDRLESCGPSWPRSTSWSGRCRPPGSSWGAAERFGPMSSVRPRTSRQRPHITGGHDSRGRQQWGGGGPLAWMRTRRSRGPGRREARPWAVGRGPSRVSLTVRCRLSIEAQAETTLMMATNNIFGPADGSPIRGPTRDIVMGSYYPAL